MRMFLPPFPFLPLLPLSLSAMWTRPSIGC